MRRPWWDKPSWTRHVTTGPAGEATRPLNERCGLTSAEQAVWFKRAAELGVDMHEVTAKAIADQEWLESATDTRTHGGPTDRIAWVLIAAAAIILVIGVLL